LKVGSQFVASDDNNYAGLFNFSEFKFRYDAVTMRIIGYNANEVNHNKAICLYKKNGEYFKIDHIEDLKNSYSYLELKECNENVLPNEQFYLVTKSPQNQNEFKIFSLLEKSTPESFSNLFKSSYENDLTNPANTLCTGSHQNYLWVGACDRFVIHKWNEEVFFHWSY